MALIKSNDRIVPVQKHNYFPFNHLFHCLFSRIHYYMGYAFLSLGYPFLKMDSICRNFLPSFNDQWILRKLMKIFCFEDLILLFLFKIIIFQISHMRYYHLSLIVFIFRFILSLITIFLNYEVLIVYFLPLIRKILKIHFYPK